MALHLCTTAAGILGIAGSTNTHYYAQIFARSITPPCPTHGKVTCRFSQNALTSASVPDSWLPNCSGSVSGAFTVNATCLCTIVAGYMQCQPLLGCLFKSLSLPHTCPFNNVWHLFSSAMVDAMMLSTQRQRLLTPETSAGMQCQCVRRV